MLENQLLNTISQQVHELHNKISSLFIGFGIDPMPNSIAAMEMSSADPETVMTAHGNGSLLIEVASDNLSAFSREINEPVLPFALCANIRSVLEAASISVWLLDKNITINERISRSYAFRCNGLEQKIRWAIATKFPVEIEDSKKRYQEVIRKAEAIGITKVNKSGKTILKDQMPTTTDMVRNQLHEEAAYRLLSAMTHAEHWVLLALGYETGAKIPYGRLIRKTLKIESIDYLALVGLNAFQKQIMCKCRLFGWPVEGIETAFTDAKKAIPYYFES